MGNVGKEYDNVRVLEFDAVVVGSGAAGYAAAERLKQFGVERVALVTEDRLAGTSRNAGSDKQTYYKLSLSGRDGDSVYQMAEELFSGGCVDGDHALQEAALSVRCFFHLAELGVRFPFSDDGEYVGYKTDHDPRTRATSAGPYTSRMMTECLERAVCELDIPVYDGYLMTDVLVHEGRAEGILCISTRSACGYTAFRAPAVILATGGPAGMFENTVYPVSQTATSGAAFRAGALGKNLTEWQLGLASVSPRWNVSGTYMQVIPRIVSAAADGSDAREFLREYFPEDSELMLRTFLKGYQWPFDVAKMKSGSSAIDLAVFLETQKGRRVYLDFMENPGGVQVDFSSLPEEARVYLEKSDACFGKPIDRLLRMNTPAYEFYLEHGVDLAREMLEIRLSVQHNNGGISIDQNRETAVRGLYAIGECAATHGVKRPGGSALNAGQTGALKAALVIAERLKAVMVNAERRNVTMVETDEAEESGRDTAFSRALETALEEARRLVTPRDAEGKALNGEWTEKAAGALLREIRSGMDEAGGAVRERSTIRAQLKKDIEIYEAVTKSGIGGTLTDVFRLRDALVSQIVYLSAMLDYAERGGKSRGSGLYPAKRTSVLSELTETETDLDAGTDMVQEVLFRDGDCEVMWRPVRPIPYLTDNFETVWRSFREKN